ncbi:septum formation family protein [Asanoa sp. NPDC049518]|uniref:septum formation family protein n=1 Tax=unclassified Asanoa TaxID=2685164 RepID=UPI0034218067
MSDLDDGATARLIARLAPWRLHEDDPRFRPPLRPAVVGLVAVLLVVLPVCGFLFLHGEDEIAVDRSRVGIEEMLTGRCFNEVNDRMRLDKAMPVACTEPHEVEVVAIVNLPYGGTDLAMRDEAESRCVHAFEAYAPAFVDDPGIEISYVYPDDPFMWHEGDTRRVVCIAGDPARERAGSLH